MESTDLCSKPKRARSTNFSIMEISTIHNEVKQNSILESKHSNTVTNQKKQSVWKSITEKVNAVGTAHRTVTEVKDKWRNMCRDAKQKFAEHKRESKKTGGGPPPTPLSQTVSDIVDLYKDSSSFVGIPGGIETSICDQTDLASESQLQPPRTGSNPCFIEQGVPTVSSHCTIDHVDSSNAASPVTSCSTQVLRSGSPDTACSSNAALPEMNDSVLEDKRRSTNHSKKEKTRSEKKSADDVYALQCAVLEKELEKNNLQIELLHLLIKKAKKEDEELPLTSVFTLLP